MDIDIIETFVKNLTPSQIVIFKRCSLELFLDFLRIVSVKDSTDEQLVFHLEWSKIKFIMKEFTSFICLRCTTFSKSLELTNEQCKSCLLRDSIFQEFKYIKEK